MLPKTVYAYPVVLAGICQGGGQGLTVVIQGQGQTTGQLQLIPQGVTVIPGPGQQLMQAAMPNGQLQRFLFTPAPPTTPTTVAMPTAVPTSTTVAVPAPNTTAAPPSAATPSTPGDASCCCTIITETQRTIQPYSPSTIFTA